MKIRRYKEGEEQALWSLLHETAHRVNCKDYSPAQLDAWAPAQIDLATWTERLSHQDEVKNFKQVHLDEIRGALSLFMHVPRMWSENEYERVSGVSAACSDDERQEREQKWHTVFGNLVTKRSVALRLPSLHVSALCHAAVRWDKGRKLVANDFYDFHHAAAAVGYCRAFMTEKPLRSLLQQKHLQLANDYPCVVIADINEAVEWVGERIGG